MAVVFELVVTFDDEKTAANAVVPDHVQADARRFALHRVLNGRVLSLIPAGVSWGLPMDRSRVTLTRSELTALGHALYELLRTLNGYAAAMVGWDPEEFTDLAELSADWPDAPNGLVLSTAARETLPPAQGFEPFTSGFDWLPYEGEHSGN